MTTGLNDYNRRLTYRIDLDRPRYDPNTYSGRAKHFFQITNPLNLLSTPNTLEQSRELYRLYKQCKEPAGTTEEQVWRAKVIYESAFHPGTGEKMFMAGRMSAQVPVNMLLTGCIMTFYKTTPSVIFWQWFNQTFNAVVNYTNRSATSVPKPKELLIPYVTATLCALVTALGLNNLVKSAPPIIGRYVPFAAVAAANCVNIPLMRQDELIQGIQINDEHNVPLGRSKKAARKSISQVAISRIMMACPGMLLPPILMNWAEKRGIWQRFPWAPLPVQILLCGLFLTFSTPMCCAIFPQISSLRISKLEPEVREAVLKQSPGITKVYFNKGL